MSLSIVVINVVLGLLSLTPSVGTIQALPYCKHPSALAPDIRDPLFAEITIVKQQYPNGMIYSCDLDVQALDLLTKGDSKGLKNTTFTSRRVQFDVLAKNAAQAWFATLKTMVPMKEFGCNMREEPHGVYEVGCLYKN
ncbi:hypothetical protein RB195_007521 [Necator americanus]|uniref:SCP domain-containing protein n=1 Tax=Necator americanus TaxID=51031 RepID=A0ABR1BXN4_NECAM